MKVLGVIPARGGSVGVKRKNLRDLGGLPLVAHSIKSALASEHLTEFCVSTEDEEIANVAKSFDAPVPFVRPLHLAPDVKSELVVQHAVEEYEKVGQYFDAVMMLQPTSPFRTSSTIDQAIKMMVEKKYLCLKRGVKQGYLPERLSIGPGAPFDPSKLAFDFKSPSIRINKDSPSFSCR